jgi:hypothetical protein
MRASAACRLFKAFATEAGLDYDISLETHRGSASTGIWPTSATSSPLGHATSS